MSFQIKNFASIVAAMINVARANQLKITDFSVGSVARTIMESPAAEIEELYLQMMLGLMEAIPISIYKSFQFDKLPAVGASGTVRFSTAEARTETLLIPAGTQIKSTVNNLIYSTSDDAIIEIGDLYVDVAVYFQGVGVISNCAIGTLTVLISQIIEISTVTNNQALVNGRDIESEDEQKERFRAYISTISRGTVSALRYGASQSVVRNSMGTVIERVAHIGIVEPYLTDNTQPIAWVKVLVHNGVGNTSNDLLAQVSQDLHGYTDANGVKVPGWKAAGVRVDVLALDEVEVDVTGVITMEPGKTATDRIAALAKAQEVINQYVASLGMGEYVIAAEIIKLVMEVDGVYNFAMSLPAADVTVSSIQKAMTGTVTLT